jgi:hypothetical protein
MSVEGVVSIYGEDVKREVGRVSGFIVSLNVISIHGE